MSETLERSAQAKAFDPRQAHKEGWTLLEGCGPENDETHLVGLHCSDPQAWWRVATKAREGSAYHCDALARLSECEREQIRLRFGPF
ncbi:hypothetical protein [Gluconobacter albidus]|uniref:Uncharacterized protein n=1 Tax=Gluconobacter albidus TaxID=318683 RepID=A0AAW3R1L9_9PROT|nr:hypothetical protein [Gluconobacter albidus]KXV44061.1 hypothetical protein AD941_00245 [Gluconobacter albidus]GLQ68884.1 hypothetical protein GCM10007866_13350 [Gluconobacter albidus]